MIIKKTNVNTIRNGKKSLCLYLFLFMVICLNGLAISEQSGQKNKDQSKIGFEKGDSYQSKSTEKEKSKIPPDAKYSHNGDCIVFKKDNKHLVGINTEGEELWNKKFPSNIENFAFDPKSGERINVKTKEGISAADYMKGNFTLEEKAKIQSLTHSPGLPIYVDIKGKRDLIFGDSKTGAITKSIKNAHEKNVKYFDFISKNLLLTIGGDNIIKIWNTHTYETVKNTVIHPSRIQAASLTYDRKYLVIGTYDSKVHLGLSLQTSPTDVNEEFKLKIIDTGDLSVIKEIKGIKSKILDISISADNKFVSILKDDKTVEIWDLENSYKIRSFSGEPYIDAEFGPLGNSFILVTETGRVDRYITRGIVVDSRPQYVGEKYKINTPEIPLIKRLQSGVTIAILDFTGLLIDSQVAEALSYSFRNRISNYSYIQLVERDEMNKILNEQGIQNSGVTSPEKAAEIGKILNAKKLIMGKLSKLGSTLITTIKVVDVETAKIDGGREVECQNYALENVPEIIDILLNILIEK